MCGIAGIVAKEREQVCPALERAVAAEAHRGPDAVGIEVRPFGQDWLGLGHRRLSILDLSPLGDQPMTHAATGCKIVFNGEIYNHRRLRVELEEEGEVFRSGSDTEVLLAGVARHGPQFIRKLQGMYAFALFDPRGPSLLLARDPTGIKPLYVAASSLKVIFASEVRAILASGLVPRTLSKAGVAGLLAYGAVQQPLTIIESIRMLPSGAWQLIEASADGFRVGQPQIWWQPPEPEFAQTTATEIVVRTREILDEAVRDHLVSDVPVGVFLSAGLDSSAIAGLAARHSSEVLAFTVGFSEHADINELQIATETAKRFGLRHTAIRIPDHAAEEAAYEWLAAADQPSMDGLNTFVISKAVRQHGVKVALCGLGADELFGGYPSFQDVPGIKAMASWLRWMPEGGRRALAQALTFRRSTTARGKFSDMLGGRCEIASLALQRRRLLNDRQLGAFGLSAEDLGLTPDFLSEDASAWLPPPDADPGWAISVIESRFYQTNVLLRDSDANGMAHSLEIRVPFLDQRLLTWMHGLPGRVRFPPHCPPKHLLRQSLNGLLSSDLLARPKTGFVLPLRRWMAGPLRAICEKGLAALKKSTLLRPEAVDSIWKSFLSDTEGPMWTRALVLASLGDYMLRLGL